MEDFDKEAIKKIRLELIGWLPTHAMFGIIVEGENEWDKEYLDLIKEKYLKIIAQ